MNLIGKLAVLILAAFSPAWAGSAGETKQAGHMHHGVGSMNRSMEPTPVRDLSIPDVLVTDQNGREIPFYSALVRDRVVAINTIFTTCTTICPPMGAIFSQLQDRVKKSHGSDVQLISVSIDPVIDTPERLKAWAAKFGAEPGWTLVTGEKTAIDKLLKGLNLFAPEKEEHSPLVLIGNDATGSWQRTYGLAPAARMAELIEEVIGETKLTVKAAKTAGLSREADEVAKNYFTDVALVNQDGDEMRLYSDLIQGKVVVINSFFTTCTGVCPIMSKKFTEIANALDDRVGKDVHLISISVDPETDTVPRLKEYAERINAPSGWYFLGGQKENVDQALTRLGQIVPTRENHKNIFIIGNARTGLWKKAFGLAPDEEILRIVEEVVNDG